MEKLDAVLHLLLIDGLVLLVREDLVHDLIGTHPRGGGALAEDGRSVDRQILAERQICAVSLLRPMGALLNFSDGLVPAVLVFSALLALGIGAAVGLTDKGLISLAELGVEPVLDLDVRAARDFVGDLDPLRAKLNKMRNN